MSASEIVNKVWNYAHVLRALQNPFGLHQVYNSRCSDNDGVGYGDYVEAAPGVAQASFSTSGLTFSLPPAALVHPCTSQLPINEVPHECV